MVYQISREGSKLSNIFVYLVCSLEFTCAHHGEAVRKRQWDPKIRPQQVCHITFKAEQNRVEKLRLN
jgi:hypothetical protein